MAYLNLNDLAKELAELDERDEEDDDNPLDEDERDRRADLRSLAAQLDTTLWEYAANESTLIEDIDFEDYAREFAVDVGYFRDDGNNVLMGYIDWGAWANDLKQDYLEVEFDGREYLILSY